MNKAKTKKGLLIALGVAVALLAIIFMLRLFSGEDDWICQNGVWVKHGQPAKEQPDSPCQ